MHLEPDKPYGENYESESDVSCQARSIDLSDDDGDPPPRYFGVQ